nr:hypothetical protein [Tanacetum cinerariifolium]
MSKNLQTDTTSALHNEIIKADGKDRPLLLPPALQMNRMNRKFYTPATPGTADAPPIHESRVNETYATVLEEIRKRIKVEAEAVLRKYGIDNDIYSTINACLNAKEICKAIERLKQDSRGDSAVDEDTGPIFDKELLEKVYPNDDYNVFATVRQHLEQPESINDTYVLENVDSNITPYSLNMCYDEGKAD